MTELFIETNYGSQSLSFWLRSKRGGKNCYYSFDGENLIETTVEEGCVLPEQVKPFLKLPHYFGTEFISLIAEHANKNGIKTETKSFLEGELVATKKHLEDVQKAFNAMTSK